MLSVVGGYIERIRKCRHSIAHIDIASSRLTCGFASAFERAMEAMPDVLMVGLAKAATAVTSRGSSW